MPQIYDMQYDHCAATCPDNISRTLLAIPDDISDPLVVGYYIHNRTLVVSTDTDKETLAYKKIWDNMIGKYVLKSDANDCPLTARLVEIVCDNMDNWMAIADICSTPELTVRFAPDPHYLSAYTHDYHDTDYFHAQAALADRGHLTIRYKDIPV